MGAFRHRGYAPRRSGFIVWLAGLWLFAGAGESRADWAGFGAYAARPSYR
jgi:hypothetical protein